MSSQPGVCSSLSLDELDKFMGKYSDQVYAARKYCAECPIRQACLADAMAHPKATEKILYGGYTYPQRQKLAQGMEIPPPRPLDWKPPKRVSRYRGVHCTSNKWWKASIKYRGKQHHLGMFPLTPEGEVEAAKRYDQAAWLFHGERAALNFGRPEAGSGRADLHSRGEG